MSSLGQNPGVGMLYSLLEVTTLNNKVKDSFCWLDEKYRL